jgi:hypothetical protein
MGIGEGNGNGASLIIFVRLSDHVNRVLCIVSRVLFLLEIRECIAMVF